MKLTYLKQLAVAVSLTSAAFSAHATTPTPNTFDTIYGNNFTGSSYSASFLGGVNATFDAKVGAAAGKFSTKAGQGGYQGIGVSPLAGSERTSGEIDIGEFINTSFSTNITITNIKLGLLFDGPEYSDVNEIAQITATYADNSVHQFTFTATGETTGIWSGLGSFVNLSKAKDSLGGAWSITNPFGTNLVKSLSFTAIAGVKGAAGGAGTNQSDYTLISISAVPESETYAMILAGLAGIGFVARRKKQA